MAKFIEVSFELRKYMINVDNIVYCKEVDPDAHTSEILISPADEAGGSKTIGPITIQYEELAQRIRELTD
jgi:hypothetical protein